MTNEPLVLFDPADGVRSISSGVAIDYYLKEPAEKATIEIADSHGKTITTFTRTPRHATVRGGGGNAAAAGGDEEEGGGRGAPPPRVAVAAGMNRFTWDMRYPA